MSIHCLCYKAKVILYIHIHWCLILPSGSEVRAHQYAGSDATYNV